MGGEGRDNRREGVKERDRERGREEGRKGGAGRGGRNYSNKKTHLKSIDNYLYMYIVHARYTYTVHTT